MQLVRVGDELALEEPVSKRAEGRSVRLSGVGKIEVAGPE
jgi:hypothetical protein